MVYLKLLLTAFFWGGTFIAGRIIAADMGPFSAAFLRFAIAAVLLVILLAYREGRLPPLKGRQLIIIALLGMTGIFAYNVLFFSGLKTVTASRASVIIATNPIMIALAARVIFKEHLRLLNWMGIFLCALGAVLVISRGHPLTIFINGVGTGDIYIMGCVASWVLYALIGKKAMDGMSPVAAVTYSSVAGALMLLPFALVEGMIPECREYFTRDWYAIAYLGVFGTVIGFTWFYEGIRKIGASRAAVFINFVPVCAVVMAWMMLNETPDLSLITGAAMVVSGAFMTNRRPDTPLPQPPQERRTS